MAGYRSFNETMVIGNKTLVCQDYHNINSPSIWFQSNPLYYSTSLLYLQLSIISIVSNLISTCLGPFGQSSIVSQIFGGLVLGPSFLGHKKLLASSLFPLRSMVVIETVATFGLMFFFFAIGVKMDARMMIKPNKKSFCIGVSIFFFTTSIPISIGIILKKYISMEQSLSNSLTIIAMSQSISSFPSIAFILTELKITNTDLGRVALSSSMFCDALGMAMTAIIFAVSENKDGTVLTPVVSILASFGLVVVIVVVFRPVILWILKTTPEGKAVHEMYIFVLFVSVLVSALASELVGQHYIIGPLILGLALPDGPPLGAALVSKLDALITGLLYPTFLAVSGLRTNVFDVHSQAVWVIGIIVLLACVVKVVAVVLAAAYNDMPFHDAFLLGITLNTKGINELIMYNLCRDSKILSDQEFTLLVISVIAATAVVSPLVRALYDPSKQYFTVMRNTIQHAKRDSELRILVCIHNHETVPTIINLLEVSHATEESPIAVIAILLVKLVGRTNPMLVAHQPIYEPTLEATESRGSSRSSQSVNALRHYEIMNDGCATVQSFTSITHYATMHDEVCQIALDKRASVVIMPFHKQWAIDGRVGYVKQAIRDLNLKVLDMAPCSVGILIDRGVLSGSASILTNRSIFHIGVLFIGGADDAESIAYGARMVWHENVNLTVIRFLLFGCENVRERKRESDLIDNIIRNANVGNDRFLYKEEVVKDGVGLAELIREMEDDFDLMLIGRHHEYTPLLSGLDEWSECPELGVIGDMLASPDFRSRASVLVVQQQRVGRNLIGRSMQPVVNNERDQLVHDATWAISMERCE